MSRLLLLMSDPVLTKAVTLMLSHEKIVSVAAETGREGMDMVRHGGFDMIVLDAAGQRVQTERMCRRIRSIAGDTPMLLLVQTGEEHPDLWAGGENCLAKPFYREDLLARVRDVLQRAPRKADHRVSVGPIDVDLKAGEVTVDGAKVPLTGKEFQIMELLVQREGMTLTKDMFLSHLYGGINEPEMKIIDVFVCKLRKKLARATGGKHFIETVWGRGYVLRGPEPAETGEAQESPTRAAKTAPA